MMCLRALVPGLALLVAPSFASAHAFGQDFTLPLPVDFYVTGGVCAFIASCIVLLFFSEPTPASADYRKVPRGVPFPRPTEWAFRALGLSAFVLGLLLAYFGSQNYFVNPLPNFFWVIFLLSFTYSTGLVLGGQWRYLDPFYAIARFVASDVPEKAPPGFLPYIPVVWLYALIALELYSSGLGALPVVIGTAIVVFSAADNIGSSIWGVKTWFEKANLFSTLFGLVSRVAPFQILDGRIVVMWPGERLVREEAEHVSVLFFTLLLLGSTVLDGIRETAFWYQMIEPVPFYWDNYIGLALLALVPLALFGLYALAVYCMKLLTHTRHSAAELRLHFAFSLVPIAVAYHFAHYFSLILSQGQSFIAQISDPIGLGWDIFGTAGYQMNPSLIGADKVWYLQLSAIVLGHILAAIVAHYKAQRTFSTKRDVILSQLPMLLLMVGLTTLGLWTLAQPFASA